MLDSVILLDVEIHYLPGTSIPNACSRSHSKLFRELCRCLSHAAINNKNGKWPPLFFQTLHPSLLLLVNFII
jgi:hypothetical protein